MISHFSQEDDSASKLEQPVVADVRGKVGVSGPVQPCGTKKSKIIKLNQTHPAVVPIAAHPMPNVHVQ